MLQGLCCTNLGLIGLPLSQADLSYGLCDGYAKSGVAIEHCNADLDFRDLPVEVICHQGLAEKFDPLGPDKQHAAVSESGMRHLHSGGRTVDHNNLVAPVK